MMACQAVEKEAADGIQSDVNSENRIWSQKKAASSSASNRSTVLPTYIGTFSIYTFILL